VCLLRPTSFQESRDARRRDATRRDATRGDATRERDIRAKVWGTRTAILAIRVVHSRRGTETVTDIGQCTYALIDSPRRSTATPIRHSRYPFRQNSFRTENLRPEHAERAMARNKSAARGAARLRAVTTRVSSGAKSARPTNEIKTSTKR
jgi:hypothetical protein